MTELKRCACGADPAQLADHLALAACPMQALKPCPTPCQDCRRFAERVAVELVRVVRETQTTGDR